MNIGGQNMHIYVNNRNTLTELTRFYRSQGFNIITFGDNLRELEKGDTMIILEIRRAKK